MSICVVCTMLPIVVLGLRGKFQFVIIPQPHLFNFSTLNTLSSIFNHLHHREYDTTLQIMVNTYPWLFPGGIGDIWDNDRGKIPVKEWGQHLIRYHDGRFIKDQLFTLYLFNTMARHINNSQGSYFFNSENYYLSNDPPTLEELKQQLDNGNDSFVSMLQYHAHNIRGSDSFWRSKSKELEYWINHHLGAGHGPPTFFITLSCAENWWPDLRKLMVDLALNAKDFIEAEKLANGDFPAMKRAVKKNSVYVNEFFMKRSKTFMDTVLKEAFGIKYYWGRVEFAPGRGQIHLHILAISEDHAYLKEYHQAATMEKKANVVGGYMEDKFDYTADLQIDNDQKKWPDPQTSPLLHRFCDVVNEKEDARQLAEDCMCHICNDYCLQARNMTNPRECNKGFGKETKRGAKDTEGMPLSADHMMYVDRKGITHLQMKRGHSKRLVQHSATLLKTWRGNIDVKCLCFDTDPDHPDICEIDELIKYICAYTVKKHKTHKEENRIIQDLIHW